MSCLAWRRTAAFMTMLASIGIADPLHAQDEPLGRVQQGLVGGTVLRPEIQEELTLLHLSTGCSASLLDTQWAITAAHCVERTTSTGAVVLEEPGNVVLTGRWASGVQQRRAKEIRSFRPLDIAIILIETPPFVVVNNLNDFRREAWTGRVADLRDREITIFGRGISQFALEFDGASTPTMRDGEYRGGSGKVWRFENDVYWFASMEGDRVAGGDSGGPSFVRRDEDAKLVLTGVHSKCKLTCLRGQTCGTWLGSSPQPADYDPWRWVADTPECADAPVAPVWGQIQEILAAARTPREFVGEFARTPPNYRAVAVYAVKSNGEVSWHRQDSNSAAWSSPRPVASGWQQFRQVIPAGGNSFYMLTPDGTLRWYRHDGFADGRSTWAGPVTVASGWSAYTHIFGGSDGIVYAIRPSGELLWLRNHDYSNGGRSWTGPNVVGRNWNQFKTAFSMGEGIVYALKPTGQLVWYKHEGVQDGTYRWKGGQTVATGWDRYEAIVPLGDGIILTLDPDGKLLWHKHVNYREGLSMAATGRTGGGFGTGINANAGVSATPQAQWEGPVEIARGWQGLRATFGLLPASPPLVR